MAVDSSGTLLSSVNPTGGAAAWAGAAVDPTAAFDAVSCASASLCVAVDDAGNVLVSTSPGSTPSTAVWPSAALDSSAGLDSVSCASTGFCAIGDDAGSVLTSANPAGGAAAWATAVRPDGTALVAISCPDRRLLRGRRCRR